MKSYAQLEEMKSFISGLEKAISNQAVSAGKQDHQRKLIPDEISERVDIFLSALERDNPGLNLNRFGIKESVVKKGQLKLANKGIEFLPVEIEYLSNLTFLSLGQNKLEKLPSQIGNLVNLKTLDLGENQLTELPIEFWKLANLENLNLYKNQLTKMPVEMGNLIKLTALYLHYNKFTGMPVEIRNLVGLKTLLLTNCPLLAQGQDEKTWGQEELRQHFGKTVKF